MGIKSRMIRIMVVAILLATTFSILSPIVSWAADEPPTAEEKAEKMKETIDKLIKQKRDAGEKFDEKEERKKLEAELKKEGRYLMDNLIEDDGKKKVGNVELEYKKHPMSYYLLDIQMKDRSWYEWIDIASDDVTLAFHGINNGMWTFDMMIGRFTVELLESALTVDVVKNNADKIEEAVNAFTGLNNRLKTGFWGFMMPLLVICLGAWGAWKMIAEEQINKVSSAIFTAFVIMVFSFVLISSTSEIITKLNGFTIAARNVVLSSGTNVINSDHPSYTMDESVAEAGNRVWNVMVHQDYLLLQYGRNDVDKDRVNKILGKSPLDKERYKAVADEVKDYQNVNMTPMNVLSRTFYIIMMILKNLLLCTGIGLICAGIIIYQYLFMFWWLWAPVALVWAIIPSMQDSFKKWTANVLGALMVSFALGVLLTIYLLLSDILYSTSTNYLTIMAGQMALVIVIFWKRQEIFDFITSPIVSVLGGGKADTSFMEKMISGTKSMLDRPLPFSGGKKKSSKDNSADESGPDETPPLESPPNETIEGESIDSQRPSVYADWGPDSQLENNRKDEEALPAAEDRPQLASLTESTPLLLEANQKDRDNEDIDESVEDVPKLALQEEQQPDLASLPTPSIETYKEEVASTSDDAKPELPSLYDYQPNEKKEKPNLGDLEILEEEKMDDK